MQKCLFLASAFLFTGQSNGQVAQPIEVSGSLISPFGSTNSFIVTEEGDRLTLNTYSVYTCEDGDYTIVPAQRKLGPTYYYKLISQVCHDMWLRDDDSL